MESISSQLAIMILTLTLLKLEMVMLQVLPRLQQVDTVTIVAGDIDAAAGKFTHP